MGLTVSPVKKNLAFTACLTFLFLISSCSFFRQPARYQRPQGQPGDRLAVAGFEPAILAGQGSKTVRDPINGSVFMAEPVSDANARDLTDNLYRLLLERDDYSLIPPTKVGTAAMSLEMSNPKLIERPKEFYAKVGKQLGADLLVVGYLYRWRERKGEAYGVRRAASVAFSLSLVSIPDGAVLWGGKFDKTQRSLAENLLDLITFLKGKGRWMSARELALMGLERVVKEIPSPRGLRD